MLEVSNLKCGYGKTEILKGISFSVSPNQILCIIGPNGCGKTTMLRCLTGLLDYSGNIRLDNHELSSMKRKQISSKIALMSQMTDLLFDFSVYDTVGLGTYTAQKNSLFAGTERKTNEKILYYIDKVGLTDVKDKSVLELSGGQLQRVMLARAFVQEPEIILLDEPTNHLDLKHQIDLVRYLDEWSKEENHSVIGVMHDLNLAFELSDNFLLLNEGKIAAKGFVTDIINSGALSDVYKTDVRQYMKSSLEKWL